MNWDAMAAIAELLASIGVIVSLIYLATQIRHQTSENFLSAGNELASQINQSFSVLTDNSEFAAVYIKGIKNYDSLDSVEKLRVSVFFGRVMRIFESMYSRHRHNKIDPEIWPGIEETLRDLIQYPGFQHWWTMSRHWYSKECQALVSDCNPDQSESSSQD